MDMMNGGLGFYEFFFFISGLLMGFLIRCSFCRWLKFNKEDVEDE